MKKATGTIGILVLTFACAQILHASTFYSLNGTVSASACNPGEIGSLNNGPCNSQTAGVTPQPLSSIVFDPLVSTIDVARAETYGTITYNSISGSASATATPSSYVTSGIAEFVGAWSNTLTVTSSTLPLGTPVDLKFSLELAATLACAGASGTSAQASANFEWGLSEILTSDSTCGTTVDQTVTSIFATQVGSVTTIGGNLNLSAEAQTSGVGSTGPSASASVDPPSSGFFIDSLTPGATYTTASGTSYASPSTATPAPEPSFLIPMAAVLGFLASRRREYPGRT